MNVTIVQKFSDMRKILSFICAALFPVVIYAQKYEVEIRQVFPNSSLVYSNLFKFKRDMDNAIASQSAKLRGNNSNYKVRITTPNGSETRYIQNIVWMESVNGVKTYHKQKTNPAASYDVSTVWEGGSCNADGSVKGTIQKHEFIYRVSLAGSPNEYETAFVDKKTAQERAEILYKDSFTEDKPIKVIVYGFKDGKQTVFEKKENEKEYQAFKECKRIEEEKAAAEKKRQEIKDNISVFKTRMISIMENRDSLTFDSGLDSCRSALEEAKTYVPDSIFFKEKLDSLYKEILLNNVLLKKEGKKIRKLISAHETAIQGDSSIDSLLHHTTGILTIKNEFNKKKNK